MGMLLIAFAVAWVVMRGVDFARAEWTSTRDGHRGTLRRENPDWSDRRIGRHARLRTLAHGAAQARHGFPGLRQALRDDWVIAHGAVADAQSAGERTHRQLVERMTESRRKRDEERAATRKAREAAAGGTPVPVPDGEAAPVPEPGDAAGSGSGTAGGPEPEPAAPGADGSGSGSGDPGPYARTEPGSGNSGAPAPEPAAPAGGSAGPGPAPSPAGAPEDLAQANRDVATAAQDYDDAERRRREAVAAGDQDAAAAAVLDRDAASERHDEAWQRRFGTPPVPAEADDFDAAAGWDDPLPGGVVPAPAPAGDVAAPVAVNGTARGDDHMTAPTVDVEGGETPYRGMLGALSTFGEQAQAAATGADDLEAHGVTHGFGRDTQWSADAAAIRDAAANLEAATRTAHDHMQARHESGAEYHEAGSDAHASAFRSG